MSGWQNSSVSLLSGKANLLNSEPTGIGPGGQIVFGALLSVIQTSYEIFINCVDSAGGNVNPFVVVEMSWSNSSTGQIVAQEFWTIASGIATGPGQDYQGTGPAKGDTLTITVINTGTGQVILTMLVNQSSRIYPRDDWRSVAPCSAVNGWTNPNSNGPGGILATSSITIGAGSSITRLMPLYAGMISWWVTPGAAVTWTMQFTAQDKVATPGSSSQLMYFTESTAGASGGQQIPLPRAITSYLLKNTGSVATTFVVFVGIQEAPQ